MANQGESHEQWGHMKSRWKLTLSQQPFTPSLHAHQWYLVQNLSCCPAQKRMHNITQAAQQHRPISYLYLSTTKQNPRNLQPSPWWVVTDHQVKQLGLSLTGYLVTMSSLSNRYPYLGNEFNHPKQPTNTMSGTWVEKIAALRTAC
jgi:hypothetical protein